MNRKEIDIVTKYNYISLKFLYCFICLFLTSCSDPNLIKDNENTENAFDSCIDFIDLRNVGSMIDKCSKKIKLNEYNPRLLNERHMLYTILGEDKLACKDIRRAFKIIESNSNLKDKLIKEQITIRHSNCARQDAKFGSK